MATPTETQENSDEKNMSDETEACVKENKKIRLEDLKVADLKNELEKRNLDKNGVKSVLIERLKSALLEEGEDPNEYGFEVSDTAIVKCSVRKRKDDFICINEKIECTNGNASEEINNHEEKQEVALQLSIDEEEAQLNEDESLIEVTRNTTENKADTSGSLDCELIDSEKSVASTENKHDTPTKCTKLSNEENKEKKTPVQNKNSDGLNAVPAKALKVIGKNDKKSTHILAKSLWVTGLPNTTRAADLKALFSKQGRVVSVKIVKSTKQTPGKCYGVVTMATSKDATKTIQNLHRTELNDRVISVERKQCDAGSLLKISEAKLLTLTTKKPPVKKASNSKQTAHETKSSESLENKESVKIDKTADKKTSSEEVTKKRDEKLGSSEKSNEKKPRDHRERDMHRSIRKPDSFRPRSFGFPERTRFGRPFGRRPFASRIGFGASYRSRSNILAIQKLREEHFERERYRERRDAERRADELFRHRYIERKQKEEAYRLEREKERLRIERELLERERVDILKLEREKARLERERLEREREKLRRQAELKSTKRPFNRVDRDLEPTWDERKKSTLYDGRSSFHGDITHSSSRFEFPSRERASFNREFDRHPDRYNASKHVDSLPRSDFGERDSRREVTIHSRDERQVFSRSDLRERDHRRSFSSRERERHSSRREAGRDDWKHDRRVHERIVSSNASSSQRRMTYY